MFCYKKTTSLCAKLIILLYNEDLFLRKVSLAQHIHDQAEGWVWLDFYFHFYMAPKMRQIRTKNRVLTIIFGQK